MPDPAADSKSPKQYTNIWAVPFAVILVDQLTKYIALHMFSVVRNTGTIFGLLDNNFLWIVISLTIVGSMFYIAKKRKYATGKTERLVTFAMMLIIGGGLSNILDRITRGYVADFIKLPLWPTFNVADAAICVGVTVLLWHTVFAPKNSQKIVQ